MTANTLTFVVDEGSTYTKVAYIDSTTGKLKTLIVPNSFRTGWKTGFAGAQPANYQIGSTKYCFDKTADLAIETTNIAYQYSDISLLAVQHALIETGVTPQEVNLVVTLPVTQYYSKADNQQNEMNIEKKVANLSRKIERMNQQAIFTFKEITVMPESLPAAISELSETVDNDFERTLCIDAGGTTLDYGIIVGAYDDLSEIGGNEQIGVVQVSKRVRAIMSQAGSMISQSMANEFITKRSDFNFISKVVNDHSMLDAVLAETEDAVRSYVDAVIAEVRKFEGTINRILVVGGGAYLLTTPLKEAFPIMAEKIKALDNPQTALACEILKYKADDESVYDAEIEEESIEA